MYTFFVKLFILDNINIHFSRTAVIKHIWIYGVQFVASFVTYMYNIEQQ